VPSSTRRTKVTTPRKHRVGSAVSAKVRNSADSPPDTEARKPSATSALDTEPRNSDERAALSLVVAARAPCSVKCSVVSAVSRRAGSGGSAMAHEFVAQRVGPSA